ncbi:MAG TPA: ABC transporter ATP-binding protein [Spirochaetota bacterium]|nr:ABC transporter ATP-binding protein [Spirochaetota bacterium]
MTLSVKELSFEYKNRKVLENISFSIKKKEIITILGPNGVGKTTLLKCINKILPAAAGSIKIDGLSLEHLKNNTIAQKFSYVPQQAQANRITAFDAILLGRRPYINWHVSKKDNEIVNAIIKTLHLEKLSLRYIDEMSGGELQKVCIARALVQEPEILLLDEPTSNLDLKNQIEILCLIKHIVKEHNIAGLMTLHDINTAVKYSDKILFLKNGKISTPVTPRELNADIIKKVYGVDVEILQNKNCIFVNPV